MEHTSGTKLRTVRRKEHFLKLLESLYINGNVTLALKVSRHSRTTVYRWRKDDQEFAKKWDEIVMYADEIMKDVIQYKLRELVQKDNVSVILFCAKRLLPEYRK